MRGVPAWHRQRSFQHPSTVLALRANPPSPTRGEGKDRTKNHGRKNHSCLRQPVPQGYARQCRHRHRGGSGGSR
ncbi:hypothetical protein EOD08_17240 [Mesorhizobium sp. M6A.T.Ca.TU.002.02.2.1]|nr:hypothetical protein EOD08_17240 [Mesorhizobium sp. M6A.T.Ca.TU.002.02.2.1]